jgi:hypothetical protein
VIVTEFSPSLMQGISGIDGPAYLRWLIGLGYALSIVLPDGTLRPADPAAIMEDYRARGTDHLDLVALPLRSPTAPRARLARSLSRCVGTLLRRSGLL